LFVASDGDRGNLTVQKELFSGYEKALIENKDIAMICDSQFGNRRDPWWIADVLHVLKNQRCRLAENVYFTRGRDPINAATLNEILQLRHSLSDLTGIAKMNDVLAVQLFTFENLAKLIAGRQLTWSILLCAICFLVRCNQRSGPFI
jgi:hypothetical protein